MYGLAIALAIDAAQSREAILLCDKSNILILVFLYIAFQIVLPALEFKLLYPKYNSNNLWVYFNKLERLMHADSVI